MSAANPTDRMTLPAFLAAREAVRSAAKAFELVRVDCRSCAHFQMGDCQHFGAPVPKDFQQQIEACPHWIYDGIPF